MFVLSVKHDKDTGFLLVRANGHSAAVWRTCAHAGSVSRKHWSWDTSYV